VNVQLLPRAAGILLLLVGALFAVLALTLERDFFRENGAVVGPLAWVGCCLATGLILRLPLARIAVATLVSGLAAGAVGAVLAHVISLPVAIAVFAAACAWERGPRRGGARSEPGRA
jgi:hypothetical protein